MKTFLNRFTNGKDAQETRAQKEAEQSKKATESYNAFLDAAAGTLSAAQDVSDSLRAKIDDYTRQIEATSLVIPHALILINSDDIILNTNGSATEIFGYEREVFVGRKLSDLFNSASGAQITLDYLRQTFKETNNTFEVIMQGGLDVGCVRSDGVQFYPNIKISEFTHSDGTPRYMLLVQDITESVMQERRFIDLFQHQNAIIKAMPDILISLGSDLIIQDVHNQTGYDELITLEDKGKHINQILSVPSVKQLIYSINKLNAGSTLETWSFKIVRDNGSETHYEARAGKRGDGFLLILRDETDIVVTREELMESESHFRTFGQASNEAMMIHNSDRLLDWNPRLSEMTGFSSVEIGSMRADEFIHPLERHNLPPTTINPSSYTTLFCTKTGNPIEVAVNARPVEWKGETARIQVIRDITHLKDVENLLHLSRERYKSITENTFDVVCCYGVDLRFTFMNQTFYEYFADRIRDNLALTDIVDPRDHKRIHNQMSGLDITANVKRTVYRVSHHGETRWLDWIDRAIYDESGEFIEIQGIGRDVTDYIRISKQS